MGDWIVCPSCKTVVPHIEICDTCKNKLPESESANINNTICNLCGDETNTGEEYCWRCVR